MANVRGILLFALAGVLMAMACSSSTPAATATPPSEALSPTPEPVSTLPPAPSPTATPGVTPTPTPQLEALFDYTRAVRLLEVSEYKDAIAAYGIVIRKLPDLYLAYHGRGVAFYHEELYDVALEDFDKAIEIKPDYGDAYLSRAVLHRDISETEKAIADVRTALASFDERRDARKIRVATALLRQLRSASP